MSSNITKGGALLDDSRQFVALWNDDSDIDTNLSRFREENLLGLPSLARAADVTNRILRPRFVDSGRDVIPALRLLRNDPSAFVDACYYETAQDDPLLAKFAEEAVLAWFEDGQLSINTELVDQWIVSLGEQGLIPAWSDGRRQKVARGLLAALRDFGRLDGAKGSLNKKLCSPGISEGGFAYVAYRLHERGESSRGVLTAPTWKRWLLDDARIDHHMHRLAAQGLLYYARAGSSLRIDWRVKDLVEVTRVTT